MTHPSAALRLTLGAGLALALAACGGSSGPAPAPAAAALQLGYADATSGTVQLVRNGARSTATHLVLDVVGTDASTLSAGLFLTLDVEPTVAQWAKVQPGDPALVENGAVYQLGTGAQILKAKASGGTLTLVVGQKGYNQAIATSGVLARVALDLQPTASLGMVVLNAPPGGSKLLTDAGLLVDVSPGIGTLRVQ